MASSARIRRATDDDCRDMTEIAFRSKAWWGYSTEFMNACRAELTYSAEDLHRDEADHFIVEADQSVLGFYSLLRLADKRFDLEALFVHPDSIGQGYGKQLMLHALESLAARGAIALEIQSDPHAVDFYSAHGAYVIGEVASGSISGRSLPLLQIDISNNTAASGAR